LLLGATALLVGLTACNALLDNSDRVLRDESAAEGSARTPDGVDAAADSASATDAAASDGACSSDLTTDAKNCGQCGHDCLGGSCLAGKCQPFAFASAPGAAQVFVVDQTVYFTDATGSTGGVSWCLEGSCVTPTRVPIYTGLQGLAVDTAGVALAEPALGKVYVYPARFAQGAAPQTRATIAAPVGVALDAANVYFSTSDGSVHRVGRAAGGVTRVSTGTAPGGAVAVDDTLVYWGSSGSGAGACATGCLQGAPKTANDTTTSGVSLGRQPRNLHASGGRLFWTGLGGPAGYQGELSWRENGLAGNEFFYARQLGEPWGVTTAGADVFFTVKSDGTVRRVARSANEGPTETIAFGQSGPRGIAADAKAVYWADTVAGKIMKLAR
jgi:hypothetical protein